MANAEKMRKIFLEIIIAPDFDEDAYANAILRELTHPTIKKSDLEIAAKKFEESENLKKYENLFLSLAQK